MKAKCYFAIFAAILSVVMLTCCNRVNPRTLTYCVHYPSRIDTVSVRCSDYRYESYKGSNTVQYCTNLEPHCICNNYIRGIETTAPIEIISYR